MIFRNQRSIIKRSNTISSDELIDLYGLHSYELSQTKKEEIVVCSKNKDLDLIELENLCKELGLDNLLKKLPEGLNTSLRERGGNLSSGERQLLSVARVAIRNPVVLIMDEATAFMDPSTEATLQKDLERILSKRTALVIAHRLATIESSDKILVLKLSLIHI